MWQGVHLDRHVGTDRYAIGDTSYVDPFSASTWIGVRTIEPSVIPIEISKDSNRLIWKFASSSLWGVHIILIRRIHGYAIKRLNYHNLSTYTLTMVITNSITHGLKAPIPQGGPYTYSQSLLSLGFLILPMSPGDAHRRIRSGPRILP